MQFMNLTRGNETIYVNIASIAGIIDHEERGSTLLLTGIGNIQVVESAKQIIDHMAMGFKEMKVHTKG